MFLSSITNYEKTECRDQVGIDIIVDATGQEHEISVDFVSSFQVCFKFIELCFSGQLLRFDPSFIVIINTLLAKNIYS